MNDARGLPVSITEASGKPESGTTEITYDQTFHLTARIVEAGLTTDLTYDGNGNLLTKTLTDAASGVARKAGPCRTGTWKASMGDHIRTVCRDGSRCPSALKASSFGLRKFSF